jgi:hypothetical protein
MARMTRVENISLTKNKSGLVTKLTESYFHSTYFTHKVQLKPEAYSGQLYFCQPSECALVALYNSSEFSIVLYHSTSSSNHVLYHA